MTELNTAFLNGLKEQAEGCKSCADLQEISDKIISTLNAQLEGINAQIALLQPLEDLLELPMNPAEIITWIQKLVTGLIQPMLIPLPLYQLQLVQLTEFVNSIMQLIQNLSVNFPNCEITQN